MFWVAMCVRLNDFTHESLRLIAYFENWSCCEKTTFEKHEILGLGDIFSYIARSHIFSTISFFKFTKPITLNLKKPEQKEVGEKLNSQFWKKSFDKFP